MKLFVYGSLKRGFFNHTRAGFDKEATFVAPATARGVALKHIDGYPYPHATEDTIGTVRGEVYEVDTNGSMMDYIRRMEQGAGYKEITVPVTVDGAEDTASIFVSVRAITAGATLEEWTKEMQDAHG